MNDNVKQLFRRVSLFRGLSNAQLERLATITHSESFDANDVIFEQGVEGDKMYIVHSGQVEVQVKDHAGGVNSVLIMGEGQMFGEMALLDEGVRSASVMALSPGATLYSISGADFKALCQEDTAIGYLMMHNIALALSFKIRHQNSFS